MNKGGTVDFDFCSVTMVNADHSSACPGNTRTHSDNFIIVGHFFFLLIEMFNSRLSSFLSCILFFLGDGCLIPGGQSAGFVIRIGDAVIYHGGDTNVFYDMRLICGEY